MVICYVCVVLRKELDSWKELKLGIEEGYELLHVCLVLLWRRNEKPLLCDCGAENAYFELWESWLNFMK